MATDPVEGHTDASTGRTSGATRVPTIEAAQTHTTAVYAGEQAGGTSSPAGTSAGTGAVLARTDQVRWGPIWAGVTTALATFIFLELAFFSFGWLTLNIGDQTGASTADPTSLYVMTGLAGLIAFLLGGMVAGATAMWRGMSTGIVQGALVWTLGVTSILVLTLLVGGGAPFGALSDAIARITVIQNALSQGTVAVNAQALGQAREATMWAVVALAVFFAASVIGGMLGAKMWPRNREDGVVDVRR